MAKDSPNYSLDDICNAAKKGNITPVPKAQIDIENLGYSDADVKNCLCSLHFSDFYKIERYSTPRGNIQLTYDVYKTKFTSSSGIQDNLYI